MVSAITLVEVLGYYDLAAIDKLTLERFFDTFSMIPISDEIVVQAIELRQQHKMGLGDAIIAATALVHNLKLATANVKDFQWIEQLDIINPVES
jgi:predicted nucleic acid-binding protein